MKKYLYVTEEQVREAWSELMESEGHRFVTVRPNGSTCTDIAAEDEAFNSFIDRLQKDGSIPEGMFYPGYDPENPDSDY